MTEKQRPSNTGKPGYKSPAASAYRAAKTRQAAAGDVAPEPNLHGFETFAVNENVTAARESKSTAVQDIMNRIAGANDETGIPEALKTIMEGTSPDEGARQRKKPPNPEVSRAR